MCIFKIYLTKCCFLAKSDLYFVCLILVSTDLSFNLIQSYKSFRRLFWWPNLSKIRRLSNYIKHFRLKSFGNPIWNSSLIIISHCNTFILANVKVNFDQKVFFDLIPGDSKLYFFIFGSLNAIYMILRWLEI